MTPRQALEAIKARIHGEYDNASLKSIGELSTSVQDDILHIVQMTSERETPYGVSPSKENWVEMPNGHFIVFDGVDEFGTSYVRFVDQDGGEIAYWNCDEWVESPEEVMGAICAAMLASDDFNVEYYQFMPDVEFPPGIAFTKYKG